MGITPACAGNSDRNLPGKREPWDHPRVCGEQIFRLLPGKALIGSPPRVRGTVDARIHGLVEHGITPACAGNSLPYTSI